MRIYFAKDSDPMIADSLMELNALAARLVKFLTSDDKRLFVAADTSGSPQPYDALLAGMEIEKGSGPILVTLDSSKGLRVAGSVENLKTWSSYFAFPEDAKEGDHHHPANVDRPNYIDSRALSVIVEVHEDE